MNAYTKNIVYFLVALILIASGRSILAAEDLSLNPGDTTVSAAVGNVEELITPTPSVVPTITPPPIGSSYFNMYGYTSPNALVIIQNPGIHNETFANQDGYFLFKYLSLSQFREDVCLVAHDTENRTTPPLCIPPPGSQDSKQIGPVLLPPSTSISSGNAYVGDSVTLTGQTIPNADVKLAMFTDESKQKKLSFIPTAYAYTIPQFDLKSNKKGEYSLTLPTASSQFLRMFTRAIYDGSSTPKGLTLILDIFPVWMLLFRFLANILNFLKLHLFELIIITQLYLLLMYFLKHYFKPHIISKHRQNWLALRHSTLMLLPHELYKEEKNKLSMRTMALALPTARMLTVSSEAV
ncbi:MAG: hypothetical protein WAV29_01710 [Microgenomates group bacterium]